MPHPNISQFTATASLVQRVMECFTSHGVQSFLEAPPSTNESTTSFETIVQAQQLSWNVRFGIRYEGLALANAHAFIQVRYHLIENDQSDYTLLIQTTPVVLRGGQNGLKGEISIQGPNLEEAYKLVSYQLICRRLRENGMHCQINDLEIWKLIDRIASETNRRNSRALHRRHRNGRERNASAA